MLKALSCFLRSLFGSLAGTEEAHGALSARSSSHDIWPSVVPGPLARYFFDEGHEFVIARDELALELATGLTRGRFNHLAELRRVACEWSDPNYRPGEPLANLPRRWRSFGFIALELLERGQGFCYCRFCEIPLPSTSLTIRRWSVGTEYRSFYVSAKCPAGHEQFQLLMMHARMRISPGSLVESSGEECDETPRTSR